MMHSLVISNLVDALSLYTRLLILAAFIAITTAGCSRSPRVTFYTLEPTAQAAATATAIPAVAIGPITLPELVDRPQLVVRVAANRVDILETHRWAEPLKSEISRTIAEDLGLLLGSNMVSSYLQYTGVDAKYRVLLDILRFEYLPSEGVTVEAVWSLRHTGSEARKNGHSLVREPVGAGDFDSMVAAYGRALLAVSRDLAIAIKAEAAAGH